MQLRPSLNQAFPPAAQRRNPLPAAVAIFAPALVSFGCAQAPPPDTGMIPVPAPASSEANATDTAKARSMESATAGLQPLPTPQQVIASVPLGRRDPFGQPLSSFTAATAAASSTSARGASQGAALGSAQAAGRARFQGPLLQPPKDFNITGVIRSGGITEAVVTFGDLSGSLRSGDRGGRTTDLLPSGWSVSSVNVDQGLLTLQKDGRRVQVRL